MSTPLFWPTKTYFYPIGNTPAVCLTQDLPPGQSADVLLLGCGDARNVLYTVYADLPSPSGVRKLDFTCCDYQPAILARNILLYVMIVENEPIDKMWNIYYHFFFDESSFAILVRHCKTLLTLSTTADEWHKSKYGPWLKVIDSNTLSELRHYWQLYVNFKTVVPKKKSALRSQFEKLAAPNKEYSLNFTAARSAGPLALDATDKLSKLFIHFWKTGTTFIDIREGRLATLINPTFVHSLEGQKFEPHYGTFPLQSFHLASAFVPVTSVSRPVAAPDRIVDTAKDEFGAWCMRFRQVINDRDNSGVTIRVYAGDALAFCSGLSHYSRTGDASTPFYSTAWRDHPVHLDHASSTESPTSFDVIDSSNLADHLGLMNILLVAEPLLKNDPDRGVVMYTETLLPLGEDAARSFPQRLCGDPQVMAILIGLIPRPLVMRFQGTSISQELLHYRVSSIEKQLSGQYYERVCWVRPVDGDNVRTTPALLRSSLNPRDIGALFFGMYDKMLDFEHNGMEDLFRIMSSQSKSGLAADITTKERIRYTRRSFAQLLRHIRDRIVLSDNTWKQGIGAFIDNVVDDRKRFIGTNLLQDLLLQLHIQGVYTSEYLEPNWTTFPTIEHSIPQEVFPGWPRIPPVLCIILTVPRHAMRPLLDILDERDAGTPVFLIQLRTSEGHLNVLSSLHAVPGKLNFSQEPPLVEESKGPFADAPSFVFSCWAPTWLLTLPRTTVDLIIQNTPHMLHQFMSKLGPMLTLYSARLTDKNSVRVLRTRPNVISELNLPSRTIRPSTSTSLTNRVSVDVTHTSSSISTFTGRLDICEDRTRATLLQGAAVTTHQIGPCTVEISIGTIKHSITYPFPILGDQRKLRIARKSCYIEVIVPPSGPLSRGGYSLDPFPVVSRPSPAAWGLHAINLDHLPVLDARNSKHFGWLNPHVSLQMSDRERMLRGADAGKSDALMNVKDSIHSIFISHAGLDEFKDRPRVFGLTEPDRGGIHTLLFIDKLRLDLAAFTVVADMAVLPLENGLMRRLEKGLQILTEQGLRQVVTRGSEAEAWRKLLPALVERCRTWTHKKKCEYTSASGRPRIPISSVLGDPCICSCGRGVGMESLQNLNTLASWKHLRSFATRAALGPLFAVPYVEPVGDNMSKIVQDAQDVTTAGVLLSRNDDKCIACGGPGTPKLLVCSRCKKAKYCSSGCQKADWKMHKKVCQT